MSDNAQDRIGIDFVDPLFAVASGLAAWDEGLTCNKDMGGLLSNIAGACVTGYRAGVLMLPLIRLPEAQRSTLPASAASVPRWPFSSAA